jgi:hypothetical protein
MKNMHKCKKNGMQNQKWHAIQINREKMHGIQNKEKMHGIQISLSF